MFMPRRFRVSSAGPYVFPVVMCLCFVCWGARPWTGTVVLAAAVIALLAPAVAADLLRWP